MNVTTRGTDKIVREYKENHNPLPKSCLDEIADIIMRTYSNAVTVVKYDEDETYEYWGTIQVLSRTQRGLKPITDYLIKKQE